MRAASSVKLGEGVFELPSRCAAFSRRGVGGREWWKKGEMKRWWMALVRGVICLSLSDWAPAVAPSLAPLHSPRPTTPHLSQMGGWMDGARQGGRKGGTEIQTRTGRERRGKSLNSEPNYSWCIMPQQSKEWLENLILRLFRTDTQ